jgi:hypothetical protein
MLTDVLKAIKMLSCSPKNSQDVAVLTSLKAVQNTEKNHPTKIKYKDLFSSHARALWEAMEKVWQLPAKETITDSGPEWILHLLDGKSQHEGALIALLFWRNWFVRNEAIHNRKSISTNASVGFLTSYLDELLKIQDQEYTADCKGKKKASLQLGMEKRKKEVEAAAGNKWEAPGRAGSKLTSMVRSRPMARAGWESSFVIIWVVSFCPLGEPFSMLHRRKKSKHWLAWKVYG